MATHTPTGDLLEYPIRIIDTHTLDLETDTSLYAKHYAILSHTWLQAPEREVVFGEVKDIFAKVKEQWPPATFEMIEMIAENYLDKPDMLLVAKDFEKSKKRTKSKNGGSTMQIQKCKPAVASTKLAGIKLLRAIDTARRMGYRYLWVDCCCNDQSNQKELQKALVSMGLWYANAHVCLVSLEKCSFPKHIFKIRDKANLKELTRYCLHGSWCARGWTVQEIIMCRRAIFLNKKWEQIVEYDRSLLEWKEELRYDELGSHMGFISFLANVPLDLICVGQRPNVPATRILSLTIFRQTTRPEDRAYSLMGILGVQMEVRYGEGLPSALERLCNSITGPERKSALDWLDKVKRSDEPEQMEIGFLIVWDVQVARLNAIDLRRGLLALAKHEKESGTVGTTYQFECSLNNFAGYTIKEPIQIIVACPLGEIQDIIDGTTFWAVAKLPHTKGDVGDLFLCSSSVRRRAQIKSPSSDWIPGQVSLRRLCPVNLSLESGDVASDLPKLFNEKYRTDTVNWEGGFDDQHASLEKGKNITQDFHIYLNCCRKLEMAASSPYSAIRVLIPWIPEEGSGRNLQYLPPAK